jgi:hypothetical protein
MSESGSDCAVVRTQRRGWGDKLGRRLWPLDAERLCATARHRTGLADFGDPPLQPALSVLVQSLEGEADLHPLGRFLMRTHLEGLLTARLRLVEEWKKRAACPAPSRIERPIFITGMPRSGSTFLHELLAQDPDNRAPRAWEVMFPLPAPKADSNRRDWRVKRAAASLWWFRRLAPGADAVHPIRARTPQECVAIHSYTFLSEEFIATAHVPAYESFLHAADLRPAYAWQKRFLQHLQSRQPTKRWVLKSPDHVYGLEALFAVFPDAVIVQTHRNPVDVLKSCIRLVEVLHGLFGRPRNRRQLSLREARMLAWAMERLIQFREAHLEWKPRFCDVKYSELVADPVATVRSLYQHLDLPLSETAEAAMRRFVSSRSRYARPGRLPTPADLQIAAQAEASRFQRYCLHFGIPWQQPETG